MEPWLTPDESNVFPRKADLLKGLDQVLYWLDIYLRNLPEEALGWTPAPEVPPIGARLQHIIGASRRLATYALEDNYDPHLLAATAERDWEVPHRPKAELLAEVRQSLTDLRTRIAALPDETLDEVRPVGRRQIPVRRAGILHHLVEHAAYHAGQVALLARLWEARREERPRIDD